MKRCAGQTIVVGVLVAVGSVITGACSGTTTALTATPTALAYTETYSGTLAPLGAAANTFTINATGPVSIGLTDVEPDPTVAIGVAIGAWDGAVCRVMSQNDAASIGGTAMSGTAVKGSYCVQVYDAGTIPDGTSITYAVQVVHP